MKSAAVATLVLSTLVSGCGSGPVRALAGARAYGAGTSALETGDYALAIRRLERAAELVPHGSEIRNHLGLAYWSAGDPESARQAFERAIELDCDNLAARTNLARLDAEAPFASPTRVEGGRVASGGSTDGER